MPDSEPKARCELCELLICAYVTAVEQQLSIAMRIDRITRFGDKEKFDEAVSKLSEHINQEAIAWENFLSHQKEHAQAGPATNAHLGVPPDRVM